MSNEDKTAEQLRSSQRNRPSTEPGGVECHSCGEVFIGDESHTQCGICANTRADSGEAIAWASKAALSELTKTNARAVNLYGFKPAPRNKVRDHIPLFTHPRATSVDVLAWNALREFVEHAHEIDLGGGDAVVTTCESLELARAAIASREGK